MSVKYKNYMEDCVESIFETVYSDLDMCKCENCKMDTIALALNMLKPKYVVTKEELMYEKLDLLQLQMEVDVVTALTNASEVVKQHPRH